MKLHTARTDVDYFGANATKAFSIKASGKAFQILSSGLYRDKIQAIVRELSCNALDAHRAAGTQDRPFDVHLPTALEPFFSIRDYGIGLSDTAIKTLYTTYFESTKTDSNDFVGALGLGSKSPFSYIDTFTVTSFFNGEKRTYTAFIDDSGLPNIVEFASPEPTNEHNGLEVSMPVKREDMRSFADKARQIYRYFDPCPNVLGVPDFKPNGGEIVFSGSNFTISRVDSYSDAGVYAVMGPVAYPISDSSLRSFDLFTSNYIFKLGQHNGLRTDIRFQMGEVDFTAGREELSYDPKLTVPNVCKRIVEVEQELRRKLNEEFANCKTRYEAVQKYAQSRRNGLATIFGSVPVIWKGHDIRHDDVAVLLPNACVQNYSCSWHGDSIVIKTGKTGSASLLNPLVIDDLGSERKLRTVLRENYRNRTFAVLSGSEEGIAAALEILDGMPTTLASSLPAPERKKAERRRAQLYVSHTGSVERYDMCTEEAADIADDETVYYIVIKHDIVQGLERGRKDFDKLVRAAREAKVFPKGVPLRVVPSTVAKSLFKDGVPENWIEFGAHITAGFDALLTDQSVLDDLSACKAASFGVDRLTAFVTSFAKLYATDLLQSFVTERERISKASERGHHVMQLAEKLGRHDLKLADPKIFAIRNQIVARYPLLKTISERSFDYHDKMDVIVQYCRDMDELFNLRSQALAATV